jgi:hypothetical protein
MTSNKFTKVAQFQYAAEAHIFKGKLEASGIEVFLQDSYTIDADPLLSNAIGGVKLLVKTEDFHNAKSILSEVKLYAVDDDGQNIKCPNCQSEKIDFFSTIKDLKSLFAFLFSFLLILIPIYTKYKYRCANCNTQFDKT